MARLKQTCRKANNRVSRENLVHDISKTFKALHKLQLQSKLTGGIKEPSHWRPSFGTLLEIRRYQRTTNLLIPKLCFQRVVKSITEELFHGIRFQTQALHALQEATEDFLVSVLADTNLCALHGKRVTILPKDMQLALRIRGKKKFNTCCINFYEE
uniref:Histone H3.3-like n=1 Tax=Crassostrea virginica TaxID=6565 RepID=A0A8B8DLC5_CRAVI|nr:histone H3.3-like [Crassostrea virginica]